MYSTSHISIFFHNYYGNDQEWIDYFSGELTMPYHLFYNCVIGSFPRLKQSNNNSMLRMHSRSKFLAQLTVKESTNKGKDIGGKLVLMDAYLKMGIKSEYILLLHDKQSPYHHNGQQWNKKLFRIVESDCLQKVVDIFKNNAQAGIIASASAIRNEWDNEQRNNAYTNSELIQKLKAEYNIHPPHLQFVAGTMFWVRAALLENFFKEHPPLAIRATLEEGNVVDDMPTLTHAWERLLCWIATSQGYQIIGI